MMVHADAQVASRFGGKATGVGSFEALTTREGGSTPVAPSELRLSTQHPIIDGSRLVRSPDRPLTSQVTIFGWSTSEASLRPPSSRTTVSGQPQRAIGY
jgi:hypothetical protein